MTAVKTQLNDTEPVHHAPVLLGTVDSVSIAPARSITTPGNRRIGLRVQLDCATTNDVCVRIIFGPPETPNTTLGGELIFRDSIPSNKDEGTFNLSLERMTQLEVTAIADDAVNVYVTEYLA